MPLPFKGRLLPTKHRQLVVFLCIGAASTLTHYAVLSLLVERHLWRPVWANLAAFAASLAVAFPLNHVVTFQDERQLYQTFHRYLLTVLTGLCWNQCIMWLGTVILVLPYGWVFIVVTVVVATNNFLLSKHWAFNRPKRNLP